MSLSLSFYSKSILKQTEMIYMLIIIKKKKTILCRDRIFFGSRVQRALSNHVGKYSGSKNALGNRSFPLH